MLKNQNADGSLKLKNVPPKEVKKEKKRGKKNATA